uniref:Uncharacterized protein n=1 Tax=Meloidogyne enterolobii TaxID=390850 RepID=A0A6V7TLK5_MELEN|nr:unnamed protein product [Meloidogyne enterolobii]
MFPCQISKSSPKEQEPKSQKLTWSCSFSLIGSITNDIAHPRD